MRSNKKGFTIVELVIVIAVIAILAAVLIPTIAGLVKKAQVSADVQAVRNMNVALAAATDTPDNIIAAAKILGEAGFNTEKGRTPAYAGYAFYWYKPANQVVYVNEADGKFELIFPEKVEGFPAAKNNDCQPLEIAIEGVVKAPTVAENSTDVGANISVTEIKIGSSNEDVPEDLTTFESVIEWVNTLDEGENGRKNLVSMSCEANGAKRSGFVISEDIKLEDDVVIDIWAGQSTLAINVVGDVTIDLNGHSITQYSYKGLSMAMFVVRAGATLNIVDSSSAKTGAIYAAYSTFQLDTGATLNVYGGSFGVTPDEHRSSADKEAGFSECVFVYGGTFNMYGGTITANIGENEYYAIGNSYPAVAGTATVNLYGGTVNGWIYSANIGSFTDYGVTLNGGINAGE